jgi:hypothetical protein
MKFVASVSILGLSLVGFLWSLYAAAFFAWLTATPLTPAQLVRARYDYYVWLAVGGVCF